MHTNGHITGTVTMIWMIDIIKKHLLLNEIDYDLDIPVLIEIEYQLTGKKVTVSSLGKRIYYNRPSLAKAADNRSEDELHTLIDEAAEQVITDHFISKGYTADTDESHRECPG